MFSKLFILGAALHVLSVAGTNTPAHLAPRYGQPGNAIVANRCPYDIWVQQVKGPAVSEIVHVPARTKHVRALEFCESCGISIKVSKTKDVIAGYHTQFEYSIASSMIYYDISYVDCAVDKRDASNCPGHELGHMIYSPNKACGKCECKGGDFCPTQAYYVPQPALDPDINLAEPVYGCGDQGYGNDLIFAVCSDEPAVDKRSIAGRILVDA